MLDRRCKRSRCPLVHEVTSLEILLIRLHFPRGWLRQSLPLIPDKVCLSLSVISLEISSCSSKMPENRRLNWPPQSATVVHVDQFRPNHEDSPRWSTRPVRTARTFKSRPILCVLRPSLVTEHRAPRHHPHSGICESVLIDRLGDPVAQSTWFLWSWLAFSSGNTASESIFRLARSRVGAAPERVPAPDWGTVPAHAGLNPTRGTQSSGTGNRRIRRRGTRESIEPRSISRRTALGFATRPSIVW